MPNKAEELIVVEKEISFMQLNKDKDRLSQLQKSFRASYLTGEHICRRQ
jgi:hypothetical protein